jgi:hypothetical protein
MPGKMTAEQKNILQCWGSKTPAKIKSLIQQNLLYHSILLNKLRKKCTIERLRNIHYVRHFTTLIPPSSETESLEKVAESLKKVAENSFSDNESEESSQSSAGSETEEVIDSQIIEEIDSQIEGVDTEIETDINNETIANAIQIADAIKAEIETEIETAVDDGKNMSGTLTKKEILYNTIRSNLSYDEFETQINTNKLLTFANLTSLRVIYKSYELNDKLSYNPDPSGGPKEGKGGKRTKRRRGRGKSKKKVTRKKRVKRRKTVKKIKRKRRRTRKR